MSRRVQHVLAGQEVRPVGRPRVLDAARRIRRYRRQLEAAQAQLAALQAELRAQQQLDVTRSVRLLMGLVFYGTALGGTAKCLELAFGAEAPGKSTVALRVGELCASAEELFQEYFAGRGTCAACDEIYLSGHPVLEAVDPVSLAITALRADVAPTQAQWEELLADFATLEAAVSDQGLGVSKALAATVARSGLDLWHLLRHCAAAVSHLEQRAYERIADVDEKAAQFVATLPYPPGRQAPPELRRLEQAQRACERAMRTADDAHTVLGWLYEAAHPLDAHGRVRTPEQMRGDWEAALDLFDDLEAEELWAQEKKLRGKVTGACAQDLEERLRRVPLPRGWRAAEREELQRVVCQAWTFHHRQQTHILHAPRAAAATAAAHLGLPSSAAHLQAYCQAVFDILERTLIASSAVECVNSLTRLREGAKRHPHPKFMYLLAWLHNTRPFTEGKRKGLTPAELLGVVLPKDGWELLLDRVQARRRQRARPRSVSAST